MSALPDGHPCPYCGHGYRKHTYDQKSWDLAEALLDDARDDVVDCLAASIQRAWEDWMEQHEMQS